MKAPTRLTIEIEREADGRWIAEIAALPGALAYGATRDEAIARTEALALRVLRLTSGTGGECRGTAERSARSMPVCDPRERSPKRR